MLACLRVLLFLLLDIGGVYLSTLYFVRQCFVSYAFYLSTLISPCRVTICHCQVTLHRSSKPDIISNTDKMTYLSEGALESLVAIAPHLAATMISLASLGDDEEGGFKREALAGSKHVC